MPNIITNRRIVLGTSQYKFFYTSSLFFEYFTVQPSFTQKVYYDRELFRPFNASGIYTYSGGVLGGQTDRIWTPAAEYEQNATISLVNPASTALSLVNSPTFTQFEGWALNGTSQYMDTNYNPGDGGSYNYTINSTSCGVYLLTNSARANNDYGSADGVAISIMNARNATDSYNILVNSVTTSNVASTTDSRGLSAAERANSTTQQHYKNGVGLGPQASNSVAVPNANFYLGARNTSGVASVFSDRTIGQAYFGAAGINVAMSTILNGYMTAIGKNVY